MTIVEVFMPNAYFCLTVSTRLQQKMLRWGRRERLFEPTLRGCSSVVEHLLAKEDVASSSLVTRSLPSGGLRGSTESRPTKCAFAKISLVGRRSAEPHASQPHFFESELAFQCIS